MNKLKSSKMMLVLSVLLVLVMIGSASAADEAGNETVSTSTGVDALSQEVDSVDEEVSAAEPTGDLVVNDTSKQSVKLSSSNNDVLSDGEKPLSDLATLIRVTPYQLKVTNDYQYDGTPLTIVKENYVIDFDGHYIDGKNYAGTLLTVNANNLTIKNLKIINCNGAPTIQWNGNNGVIDNLDISQSLTLVQWDGENGEIKNSNIHNMISNPNAGSIIMIDGSGFKFTNSEIKDMTCDIKEEGSSVITVNGEGSILSKLRFSDISCKNFDSTKTGFSFIISSDGSDMVMNDCNFTNCKYSIIIRLMSTNAYISNISMIGCSDKNERALVMGASNAVNYVIRDSKFINCFQENVGDFSGIILVNNPTGSVVNCSFEDCHNSKACVVLNGATAYNCTFKNNYAMTQGAVATYTSSGSKISNCTFISNKATGTNYAGAISLVKQGFVDNCTFNGNTGKQGGAIRIMESSTIVSNCNFTNSIGTQGRSIYSNSNLNIRINSNNQWSTDYNTDVYAPGCYDNIITYLYVSQNGGGSGLTPGSPIKFNDALNMISAGGTIEFINNGETYNGISASIVKTVKLIGNGVTITTTGKPYVFSIGTTSTGSNDVEINNFKFINCICTGSNNYAPIFIRGTNNKIIDCEFIGCRGRFAGGIYSYVDAGKIITISTTISGCNFTSNSASNGPGAVWFRTQGGTITKCNFYSNSGTTAGAVNVDYYVLRHDITYCNFTSNIATATSGNAAGAIAFLDLSPGVYTLPDNQVLYCNFTDNHAKNGGAIYSVYDLDLGYSNFTDNGANSIGGAVFMNSNGDVYNCTFIRNNAASGGALYLNAKGTISNSTFINNSATIRTYSGSDIFDYNINNCEFTGNTNTVLNLNSNNGVLKDCNFTNNTEGVIRTSGSNSNSLEVTNCNFTNNTGTNGAAVYSTVKTTIKGSNFIGNNATNNGGALWLSANICSISDGSTFINNTAINYGGAVYNNGQDLEIKDSTFQYNNATNGGAIISYKHGMLVLNSVLANNYASNHGGAIYINDGMTYSVDAKSKKSFKYNYCVNQTSMPSDKNWSNIYEEGAIELLVEVYVVYDPAKWINDGHASSADGRSWENATTLNTALSIVAPNGAIIFVNGTGEVYDYSKLSGTYNQNITLRMGVTVQGNNTTFIGFYFLNSNDGIKLGNLTFTGYATSPVVWTGSKGVLNNCTFKDNGGQSNDYGGAVKVNGADLQIINSTFIRNNAENSAAVGGAQGGALYINSTGTNITGCTFDSNVCNLGSHIILTSNSQSIIIVNSTFDNGIGGDLAGSAIYIQSVEHVEIRNCNFTGNLIRYYDQYENNGAAINVEGTNYVVISGNMFKDNNATNGGAVSFAAGAKLLFVDNNYFLKNHANNTGGALYNIIADSFDSFSGNTFINNTARYGGALYINNAILIDCNLFNNSALNGSAIYSIANKLNISSSSFAAPKYNQNNTILLGYVYSTGNVAFDNVTLSFTDLDHLIKNQTSGSTVDLEFNYFYFNDYDGDFVDGVVINKTLIIDGNGFTLDGNNSVRVFNISSSVELRDLIIVNGNHTLGGAIYSTGDLKLNNVTFKNNRAVKGSAIYVEKSNNTWNDLTFEGNTAGENATVYFEGNSTVYSSKLSFSDNIIPNGLNVVGTDRIRSPVFYVNNTGIGFGIIPSERTTLTYALNNVLPNGVIYIDGDCDINETIRLNHFVNVTFVGNLTSFRKGDKVDKYLFIN